MDNTYQLSFKDQDGFIKKKVKRFRKSNFLTDVEIIGQDGSVYLHKTMILQKLPRVAQLLCELCDHFSDTTFIIPEVSKNEIERAVKNLYTFGMVSGVEELFGMGNEIKCEEKAEFVFEGETDEISFPFESGDIIHESDIKIETMAKLKPRKRVPELKIKEVQPFQDHSFEIIQSQSSSNPGLLLVDNKYKFFFNKTFPTKLGLQMYYRCTFCKNTKTGCSTTTTTLQMYYRCTFCKNTKTGCKATAVLLRDDVNPESVIMLTGCASDDEHNHEASEAAVVAAKMKKEMVDMIKVDPSKTIDDCLTGVIHTFSALNIEETGGVA